MTKKVIKEFTNIQDFVTTSKIGVRKPLDNFLVYSYSEVSPDAQFTQNAYRHHYFEISLEINECCSFQIDNFCFPLKGNRLSIIAPNRLQTNQVHKDLPEAGKGFSMFFERNFLGVHFNEAMFKKDFQFLRSDYSPSFQLSDKQLSELIWIFNLLNYEQKEYGKKSEEIIQSLTKVIFEKTQAFQHTNIQRTTPSTLVSQFLLLCNEAFLKFHTVKEYANELSVTPNYLTEVVKEQTGQTALETIHNLKLGYAKGLLRQTNLSVKQIAFELGFENPEYFNVFFKRLTSVTPNQFRQI